MKPKEIKLEECPNCGGALWFCSRGGVNCPDCFKFIRMLTPEENKINLENQKNLGTYYNINNV